jgi:hypothetical protein
VNYRPKVKLSVLRRIGWDYWDPIGIKNLVSDDLNEGPVDEYDKYLLQVVSRLCQGASKAEAASYLASIASDHMGLSSASEDHPSHLISVEKIAAYLQSLEEGPRDIL